jgi:hypothetical protein
VDDLALEEVRDRPESDVGVRTHVEPTGRLECSGAHVIPENEGPDQATLDRRERATHVEATEIAGTRANHEIDDACVIAART